MLMSFETLLSYLPSLWAGALQTAYLTAFTLVIGLAISIPVAWCRLSSNLFANTFAIVFVFFFRGAPLLVLLFLIYYGMPELPIVRETWLWFFFRDAYFCAILALSLNSAGYLSEVIAGAVRAVPRGEVEAATVAGLSRWTIVSHVVAPNALRLGLRNYGNEVIFVIKGTSVASLVTITELMRSANNVYFRTFDPVTPLLVAALLYLTAIWTLSYLVGRLEKHLSPELRVAG